MNQIASHRPAQPTQPLIICAANVLTHFYFPTLTCLSRYINTSAAGTVHGSIMFLHRCQSTSVLDSASGCVSTSCFIGSSYVISTSIVSIHGMYILALWSADSWKTKLSEKEPGNESLHRPVPVALLVVSRYALPGYGNQRVWVRGPGWPDHCVRMLRD